MNESWYIDSIDARGGRAFATLRWSDLAENTPLQDGLTAFISAPHFEPEFLNSRSIAFSLGRGHGQVGFFTEEGEVPFESLESVTEFVRRTYISGSSGDGPAEGGAEGTVPPSTGDVPPPPPLEIEFPDREQQADPVRLLLKFGEEMTKRAAVLPLEKSERLELLYDDSPDARSRVSPLLATHRIVRAALSLIVDARRRHSSWKELGARFAFQRLYRTFAKLGIVPLLTELRRKDHFNTWIYEQLTKAGYPWPDEYYHDPYHPRAFLAVGPSECDAFEDLALISVPTFASRAQSFETLQSLVAGLAAGQAEILASKRGEEYAELALLAASYLCLGSDAAPVLAYWDDAALARAFLEGASKKGLAWLSANLPKRVFAEKLETIIASASQLERELSSHGASPQMIAY
jgi:hypothetical protein